LTESPEEIISKVKKSRKEVRKRGDKGIEFAKEHTYPQIEEAVKEEVTKVD
jgi:hypothetical protein